MSGNAKGKGKGKGRFGNLVLDLTKKNPGGNKPPGNQRQSHNNQAHAYGKGQKGGGNRWKSKNKIWVKKDKGNERKDSETQPVAHFAPHAQRKEVSTVHKSSVASLMLDPSPACPSPFPASQPSPRTYSSSCRVKGRCLLFLNEVQDAYASTFSPGLTPSPAKKVSDIPCTQAEMEERQAIRGLHRLEWKRGDTGYKHGMERPQPEPRRCIKKWGRSSAGKDYSEETMLSVRACRKALDILLFEMLPFDERSEDENRALGFHEDCLKGRLGERIDYLALFGHVKDRLRSVRADLHVQHLPLEQTYLDVHEASLRFDILSVFLMWGVDFGAPGIPRPVELVEVRRDMSLVIDNLMYSYDLQWKTQSSLINKDIQAHMHTLILCHYMHVFKWGQLAMHLEKIPRELFKSPVLRWALNLSRLFMLHHDREMLEEACAPSSDFLSRCCLLPVVESVRQRFSVSLLRAMRYISPNVENIMRKAKFRDDELPPQARELLSGPVFNVKISLHRFSNLLKESRQENVESVISFFGLKKCENETEESWVIPPKLGGAHRSRVFLPDFRVLSGGEWVNVGSVSLRSGGKHLMEQVENSDRFRAAFLDFDARNPTINQVEKLPGFPRWIDAALFGSYSALRESFSRGDLLLGEGGKEGQDMDAGEEKEGWLQVELTYDESWIVVDTSVFPRSAPTFSFPPEGPSTTREALYPRREVPSPTRRKGAESSQVGLSISAFPSLSKPPFAPNTKLETAEERKKAENKFNGSSKGGLPLPSSKPSPFTIPGKKESLPPSGLAPCKGARFGAGEGGEKKVGFLQDIARPSPFKVHENASGNEKNNFFGLSTQKANPNPFAKKVDPIEKSEHASFSGPPPLDPHSVNAVKGLSFAGEAFKPRKRSFGVSEILEEGGNPLHKKVENSSFLSRGGMERVGPVFPSSNPLPALGGVNPGIVPGFTDAPNSTLPSSLHLFAGSGKAEEKQTRLGEGGENAERAELPSRAPQLQRNEVFEEIKTKMRQKYLLGEEEPRGKYLPSKIVFFVESAKGDGPDLLRPLEKGSSKKGAGEVGGTRRGGWGEDSESDLDTYDQGSILRMVEREKKALKSALSLVEQDQKSRIKRRKTDTERRTTNTFNFL